MTKPQSKVEQLEKELTELWDTYESYDDAKLEVYKRIAKIEAELNRLDGREI